MVLFSCYDGQCNQTAVHVIHQEKVNNVYFFSSFLLHASMILVYGMVHVTFAFSPLIFVDLQFPGADVVGCQGAGDSWKFSFTNVRLETVDLPALYSHLL